MGITDDLIKQTQEKWAQEEKDKISKGMEGIGEEEEVTRTDIFIEEYDKLAEESTFLDDTETSITLRHGEDVEVRSFFVEAEKMLAYAKGMSINTLDDSKLAVDDLASIATLRKAMANKRQDKLYPFKIEMEAIRETYDSLMEPVLEAERILKAKQIVFLNEQKRRQQEQEEINRKRMEAAQAEMALKGELSESVNLVEVIEAPERIRTAMGMSGLTDCWKYEVVDFAALSDEYKVADTAMLSSIAKKHHDTKKVSGVRFYNEPYLATRSR